MNCPKILLYIFFFSLFLILRPSLAIAKQDPRTISNNKVGVHILFPSEIDNVANLVNGNGGDWGYVTIPIQRGDRDLVKWQTFMDKARMYHLIPIIRLATENNYFNTQTWSRPTYDDVLDFANFLSSLNWPTVNRYVVIFNEVNRGDEWGGAANPAEYADMLSYAKQIFQSKSDDFFILSAGLDNGASNQGTDYMSEYTYMQQMEASHPGIFEEIDGIASHSYPNPGFAQPPSYTGRTGIASFRFENSLIKSFSGKELPVFITETGWSTERVSDELASSYYNQAFSTVWNDNNVVAVTPFLLSAGAPFVMFSLMQGDGHPTSQYEAIKELQKVQGKPDLTPITIASSVQFKKLPVKEFDGEKRTNMITTIPNSLKTIARWIMKF